MLENSLVESILEKAAINFHSKIKAACKINNRTLHSEESDFPVFNPANSEFFEYKYFEGVLEWYIRDYLVTPILYELWIAKNIKVVKLEDSTNKGNVRVRFQYNNASYFTSTSSARCAEQVVKTFDKH